MSIIGVDDYSNLIDLKCFIVVAKSSHLPKYLIFILNYLFKINSHTYTRLKLLAQSSHLFPVGFLGSCPVPLISNTRALTSVSNFSSAL